MKLEYTIGSVADFEDKLRKQELATSLFDFMQKQDSMMSMSGLLLFTAAGLNNDIKAAETYIIDWSKENNKAIFEIYEHLMEAMQDSGFFNKDSMAQAKGEAKKAKELQLSKK